MGCSWSMLVADTPTTTFCSRNGCIPSHPRAPCPIGAEIGNGQEGDKAAVLKPQQLAVPGGKREQVTRQLVTVSISC